MTTSSQRLRVRKGASASADAEHAAAELAAAIAQPDMQCVIFFCSSNYDLPRLGKALTKHFDCRLIGCTSAGEIAEGIGYAQNGIVGVSIASPELRAHPVVLKSLRNIDFDVVRTLTQNLERQLTLLPKFDPQRMFGLLLIDGMSMQEEQVAAWLFNQLQGIPIIGGSAGDDLKFKQTQVCIDGEFISDAAVFTLFETTLPFKVFRSQHFEPTEARLVITDSDPATRTVREINGEPAAEEFARILGLDIHELTPQMFATHPVMLRIGGEYFVRSIQKANPDGSLTFFCAIDNGLVLTVAKATGLLDNMRQNLDMIDRELPTHQLIIGCDCILRRLELNENHGIDDASAILAGTNFIGFSTYGEQFNGIHVNQTLTGVAIGT